MKTYSPEALAFKNATNKRAKFCVFKSGEQVFSSYSLEACKDLAKALGGVAGKLCLYPQKWGATLLGHTPVKP